MGSAKLLTRIPRRLIKTITFDGTAGSGLSGSAVAIGTVTGSVIFLQLTARVTTSLTSGGSPTLRMGVSANTNGLIAQVTDATNLLAGDWWAGATSPIGVATARVNLAVVGDIILTIGTADIDTGVIEFVGFWLPLSNSGNIS